ncbi:MAG: hypothetical protein LQ344_002430 [Seirophora lacunosa]|nr:MAG: hypothetical protein LQ344_002430 [Seirophora lacunosa]
MAGGRRNAIVPPFDSDSGADVRWDEQDDGLVGEEASYPPQERQPSRLSVIEALKSESPGSHTATTPVTPLTSQGGTKRSRIPRPREVGPRGRESSLSPSIRVSGTSRNVMREATTTRHMSMNAYLGSPRTKSRQPTTPSSSESKLGASSTRSKSVATKLISKARVGSRVSMSGLKSDEDQLWYAIGTPKPSPRNKRLSAVEKHEEAFRSSLAQSLNAEEAVEERDGRTEALIFPGQAEYPMT